MLDKLSPITPTATPELELRAITASYGTHKVVHGIDLQVGKGELVALLGPSGCGKSTTLRLIAGLESVDTGDIRVRGQSMVGVPPHLRAMGVMFQDYALFPHMTVEKNVGYGLRMRRLPAPAIRKRVEEMMDLVGLIELRNRLPAELSGGQRQRVALARALAIEPAVLLLDEPFAALDRHLRQRMQSEIRRIQQATSIATIFVTHDQEEALAISDRIAVMSKGLISDIGEPRRIYDQPGSRFALDFIGGRTTIPVTVIKVENGIAHCALRDHFDITVDVEHHLEFEPQAGAPAALALRLEQIRVRAQPLPGHHCVPARITERIFLGTTTHYALDIAGTVVNALEPSTGEQPAFDTNEVYACWPIGAGWLIQN